jgi:hypothetical protein
MKTKVAFLLSLALLCPIAASTQNAPPNRPDFSAMRATMQQFKDLRKSERAHVLASLSSAHRAYLASVVGQLAIATNPDPRAAAAQLDAKLSAGEKQGILNAEHSYREQTMALHQQVRAKMAAMRPAGGWAPPNGALSGSNGGPPCGTQSPGHHAWANGNGHGSRTPDAGRILLEVAGIGHPHGMFMMMGGPGMHGFGMRGCAPVPSPAS